jgi:hypothetical protein
MVIQRVNAQKKVKERWEGCMTVPNQQGELKKKCSSIAQDCAKMCEKRNAKVGKVNRFFYAGLLC